MKNIICKLLGHKIGGIHEKRMFARCSRCFMALKISFDDFYRKSIIIGDYGNQKTFIWCDCGNELCSTDSHTGSGDPLIQADFEFYKCSKCGDESRWNFGTPAPIKI